MVDEKNVQPRVFTGDLEANGLLDDATELFCGVFKNHANGELHSFYPGSHPDHLGEMLRFMDSIDVLLMHGGTFYDWPLLEKLHGWQFKGKKVDTLLMSRLQRPNRMLPKGCPTGVGPHSVQAWGYRLGRGKVDNEDWSRFTEHMLHRCTEDVEIQHLIYHALMEEGKGEGWRDAHMMTFRLFELLQRQQQYGWKVDMDHMDKCIVMLTHWMQRIDSAVAPYLPLRVEVQEIKKAGEYGYVRKPFKKDGSYSASVVAWSESTGQDISQVGGVYTRVSFRTVDLDSNNETKDYLLGLGWEPAEWNTNNVGERTSPKLSKDDPFDGVQGSLGRLIARRVQCRHRLSVLDGWKGIIREDGRMASVVTGLAVTARARHKNIVNVPKPGSFFGTWMRKLFVASDGWVLVGCDSVGNQIRQLAARMGDPDYIETVLHGDMHQVNADAAGIENREYAKTFFYGLIFGSGDAKTAKNARLPGGAAAGKKLKEDFFAGLPALGQLLDRLKEEWSNSAQYYHDAKRGYQPRNGKITGLDGRLITIDSEHKILVGLLQSDEAIQMSRAYIMFHDKMDEAGFIWGKDYGTVCWYHDEFTVDCKPELAETIGNMMEDSIKEAGEYYNIQCPHEGQAKIGKNWAEIH